MIDSTAKPTQYWLQRAAPGLTLMALAPLVAEVLPGATRASIAPFLFPIQFAIWGGGAVLIREVVRRNGLGWRNMLLLAITLSIAEECVIQQTSLAPLVVQIKGVEYARAGDFNYVYFLWALMYESLFVVFIPIGLAELIFRDRRDEPWLSWSGIAAICLMFVPASIAAWFLWTHIARVNVFQKDVYTPPAWQFAAALVAIGVLILLAVGPTRRWLARRVGPLRPPHPWALFVLGALAATGMFALALLAFGIRPSVQPLAAVAFGLALAAVMIGFVPRFYAHAVWTNGHAIGLMYGAIIANIVVMFLEFLDPSTSAIDLYGKVAIDLLAVLLMVWFAVRLRRADVDSPHLKNAT